VPTRPTLPHATATDHADPAREAVHPHYVSDVLHGLALLRSLGLSDGSYLLSGHSAGACIAAQAVLVSRRHHGLGHLPEPPRSAALLGVNGLYDLPALVDGLAAPHAQLRDEYERLLSFAFGADRAGWRRRARRFSTRRRSPRGYGSAQRHDWWCGRGPLRTSLCRSTRGGGCGWA